MVVSVDTTILAGATVEAKTIIGAKSLVIGKLGGSEFVLDSTAKKTRALDII